MTCKMFFVLTALTFATNMANAQTAAPSSAQNCTPTQALPNDGGIATTNRPDQPLTDKLAKSDGVLCPPSTGASDMRVPAPEAGASKMPVIPPPGGPGGDPSVRPK